MEFKNNGKSFFPLGGQSSNSSAYNSDEIASAIAGVLALGGNMLETPVYWEQVEPKEGHFDFASLEMLLHTCREADLKLIVLWFGTWKNGEMRYAPEWVKKDTRRFKRVIGFDTQPMQVLSSYCRETMESDKKAFSALCGAIKRLDGADQTVISIQIENEPGILGSDRDYGDAARAAVLETVPSSLVEFIEKRNDGPIFDCWKNLGGKKEMDWLATFGNSGYEYREAWSIAEYINEIAKAGLGILNVPMYTNAWLKGDGWQVPGFYPAAGPVAALLDIWITAAPFLSAIAPDIYTQNYGRFLKNCAEYTRDDNPLFVPESGINDHNAMNMLRAIADYDAVGYSCFGVDSVLDLHGNLRGEAALFAGSFASVRNMLPLVQKYRGTGKIRAVYHEDGAMFLPLKFEKFIGMVPYIDMGMMSSGTDHHHGRMDDAHEQKACFGLIIEANPYEFYLSGEFHLHIVPNEPPGWLGALRFPIIATPPDYLSVEEGILMSDGRFEARRKRNGDEVVFGKFWTAPDVGVVRILLNP